jgi:hypothetical protein
MSKDSAFGLEHERLCCSSWKHSKILWNYCPVLTSMTTMLATTVVMFNRPIADESLTKVRIAQWRSLAHIDWRGDVKPLSLIEALGREK